MSSIQMKVYRLRDLRPEMIKANHYLENSNAHIRVLKRHKLRYSFYLYYFLSVLGINTPWILYCNVTQNMSIDLNAFKIF